MTRQEPDGGDDGKQCGIQVIARAAAIMRTLGTHPQGLSLAAIAQAVGLPRSTVQRIVSALESEYLVEAARSGGFRLGPALGQLIYQTQTDIISLARPHLETLLERLQESVILATSANEKIYVVDRIVAEHELRVVFPIGSYVPMHSTAVGKALLSRMSDAQVRDLLPEPLPALTRNTHDLPSLLDELATIRQSGGLAADREEFIEGIYGFAVALDTYLGNYGIAVVAPASRIKGKDELFCKALLDCKRDIEQMIGAGKLPA
ncbi:IclR family transcriptional regulator [Azomonas macrocytogenes]|uniref:DNA-binding IclR family transcriptional regulator n=1 Tax=Azomonas macrocytogenes TaxID=69962 RepID=A0A839T365_AZOMA|nr:IclR family transcriptional regulator [Azomonas macrocytogenes]MBB3103110.1 DNA-binding IclR family transcriptional regulator [Azomonas macrocytogenes]